MKNTTAATQTILDIVFHMSALRRAVDRERSYNTRVSWIYSGRRRSLPSKPQARPLEGQIPPTLTSDRLGLI